MKNIIAVLLVFTITACSSSRGFDRGQLRENISEQKVVTEDDIQKAIASRPQLPSPFRLAIYFGSAKNSSWSQTHWDWVGDDKDKLLQIGPELKSKNIVSEVIIIGNSIVDGTDNRGIRLAAARAGADAVLIISGVGSIDRYNNVLGATYLLIVTPFFVPGTVTDGLVMVNASMWDVRNQFLYLSAEAEGTATETRPAVFVEERRVVMAAKTNAISALTEELKSRLLSIGKK